MPEEVRQIFKRVEKKYLLESEEFNQLRGIMSDYMQNTDGKVQAAGDKF